MTIYIGNSMIKLKQIILQESVSNVIKDYEGKIPAGLIYF